LIICYEISLFLNTNMGFLLDDPLARSYLNVLMIGHCHLMLVILLVVLMLFLVRHSIPRVVHSKLCCKLSSYGFQGKLLKWISCWLHGRMQYVKVGKHFSNACEVYYNIYSGVPQGSVLGPLLFLLFINDIGCSFGDDVTVKLFADDLKMYVTINNIKDCQVLQHGLNTLCYWTIKWQLNISIPKCVVYVWVIVMLVLLTILIIKLYQMCLWSGTSVC